AEHHAADLARADAALEIQPGDDGLSRERMRPDVREEAARIDVDRVAAGRLHRGDAGGVESVREIAHRGEPVLEVALVEHLAQADGERLEIARRTAAVRRESLR